MKGIFKGRTLRYFNELKNVRNQPTKSFTISEGRLRKKKVKKKKTIMRKAKEEKQHRFQAGA